MRSSSSITTRGIILSVLIFTVIPLSANPRLPLPVSRFCYIDAEHWTIELNLEEMNIPRDVGEYTDMIALQCGDDNPDRAAFQRCSRPIPIDTDSGVAFMNEQHFPGVKMRAGGKIWISEDEDYSYPGEGPVLPEDLEPNTIMVLQHTQSTCCDYIIDESVCYSCIRHEYVVEHYSTPADDIHIQGTLADLTGRPLIGFGITCLEYQQQRRLVGLGSTATGSSGSFGLSIREVQLPHVLRINYANFELDYSIHPLVDMPDPFSLSIRIEYPPSGLAGRKTIPENKSPAVRLLASSGKSGNPIVIAVSDNSISGTGCCELYSLNGGMIRSLSFDCFGSGTYTIPWHGTDAKGAPVSTATVFCRIRIDREVLCSSFISR
ncbi:MAG: hypothetical protein JW863_23745 [Chitinispirillaceae bacterium]|nr:hypothetical protein [Chitinispirillaceae bacterium]